MRMWHCGGVSCVWFDCPRFLEGEWMVGRVICGLLYQDNSPFILSKVLFSTRSLEWKENSFHMAPTVFIMSLCGSATFLFTKKSEKESDFFFPTLTDLATINIVEQRHFSQPTQWAKIAHYPGSLNTGKNTHVVSDNREFMSDKRQKSTIIITYLCLHWGKGILNEGDYCNHVQFNLIYLIGDGALMQQKLCPPESRGPILAMAALNI